MKNLKYIYPWIRQIRNHSVSYNQSWAEHKAEDVLSKLILLTFIFLFVIVMMNVLNAFAIGDIQVQHNCTNLNTIKRIFCRCRNCEMMHCASETRKRSVTSSSNALKFTRLTVSKASKHIIQNPTTSAASGYLTRYYSFLVLSDIRKQLYHCVNFRVSSVTGVWLKMDIF